MPNVYTPDLIAELNRLTDGLPRAEGVKAVGKRLKLSERAARTAYARYIGAQSKPLAAPTKSVSAKPDTTITGRPIKRLFWDVETSPNIGLFWRCGYKLSITHDNIIKERAIICIAWKWEHETKTHVIHWDKNQDDKAMLEEFLKVANEADEMVHHNGDKFDMPWFKTRCLFHRLPTFPDYKTADTLQWARRKFLFNSNRLDYIAKFLGFGGKDHTTFGLWKDIVLKDCPKAMAHMVKYCQKDVVLLERVWKELSQRVNVKTHEGVLGGNASWTCPRTGSTHVKLAKTRVTAAGTIQYQFQSLDNGTYYTVGRPAYEAYVASKTDQ